MIVRSASKRRRALGRIAEVLREAGYTSLDAQAKALGLSRSTAYTIIKCQHKQGRLSKRVLAKMLSHPELPQGVRPLVEEYASESEIDRMGTAARRKGRTSRVA